MARLDSSWILKFLLLGALFLVGSVGRLCAQTHVCDKAAIPCLDQPKENEKLVTGKAEPGALIEVTVEAFGVESARGLADGTFTVTVNPLKHGIKIEAKQDSPKIVLLGSVTVAGIGTVCGATAVTPCANQPTLHGSSVSGKAQAGAKLDVTVDGLPFGSATALTDATFAVSVNPLNLGQKIIVTQTAPELVIIGPLIPSDPADMVKAADKPGVICGDRKNVLCLDQPHEKEVVVTGTVAPNSSGNFVKGTDVTIVVNDEAPGDHADVDSSTGKFTKVLKSLSQYDKIDAIQTPPGADGTPSTGDVKVAAAAAAKNPGTTSSLYTLGLVGVNAAASSSSGPSQQYFAEFDLMAPLPWLGRPACSDPKQDSLDDTHKKNQSSNNAIAHTASDPKTQGGDKQKNQEKSNSIIKDDDALSRRCWIWINPRIASVPSASSTAVSSLSPSSFPSGMTALNIGQITQTFEFQAGAEYYLIKPSDAKYWGWVEPWARSAVSLIAGGGIVTPFSTTSGATEFGLSSNLAQQFAQNTSLEKQYPQLSGALCSYGLMSSTNFTCPAAPTTKPTSVAFVLPNRSRFDRDFFAGARLRFFYSSGDCGPHPKTDTCTLQNIYPGTVDFRFGEDETVTGGKLVPLVMTVTGSFPLPATSGTVRIFGSTYVRLHRNQNTTPLILIPTSPALSLDNPAVVIQQTPRSDQDYFRLGIGVDLVALIAKWAKPPASSTTDKSAPAGGSAK